jgi:hypothetical protein
LIVYILTNNLEDEPVFKDGRFIGFITASEAAERAGVGVATIFVWLAQGRVNGMFIGGTLYLPADFESPLEYDIY